MAFKRDCGSQEKDLEDQDKNACLQERKAKKEQKINF